MRALALIFFTSFISLHISAQDTVLNDVIQLKIPEHAKRIRTESVDSYRSSKGLEEDTVSNRHFVYDINGITLSLSAGIAAQRPNLKSLKGFMDGIRGQSVNYTSELRMYDNREFLILNWKGKDQGRYTVFGAYKSGNQSFGAKLEYPIDLQAKAKIILDKLLERTKFKRN